jgi:leucyl/phenylalanyl-tRNA---protein transferase
MRVPRLKANDPEWFPPLESADVDGRDGLLAIGGDLSRARLLAAYRNAIFPWYDEDGPIMWWSPAQRAVIFAERIHVSRSMQRAMRKQSFHVTWNTAFQQVIHECGQSREDGTWILPEMVDAYVDLHEAGFAQSCEVWNGDTLVGGIYGVTLGRVFFGESMFHREKNASKLALVSVAQSGFELIDCQFLTDHLVSMGAELIPRAEFFERVQQGARRS